MDKDRTVIIERAANGFIVRPFSYGDRIELMSDVFVFETFPALVLWLDSHFTKPNEGKENG